MPEKVAALATTGVYILSIHTTPQQMVPRELLQNPQTFRARVLAQRTRALGTDWLRIG